ncbi:MAG: hypothetical protein KIT31_22520 [Deltaproteobacteria bacterium]|nr:hypothetical protein [Deltaproteobacteria bacterium]
MLGEKVQELAAKVTGTRVIAGEGGKTNVEVSFQGTGKILGIDMTEMGTYVSSMRASGTLYGEGQGITISKEGDVARWRGRGVGKPTGKGLGAAYRYSVVYETDSPRLARLNQCVLVGEWEVDENGNGKGAAWEWK